ncbi:MAG: hypothetical protein ACTSRK_16130 [Promethearchaeota archaeon]
MNEVKKQTKIPRNGFYFNKNPKLKRILSSSTLLLIPLISFFSLIGNVNILLYFYTISKLLIFLNFFVLIGLSSSDLTPIEDFLQQKKLQRLLMKRRLTYMIVYNIFFYVLEYLTQIIFFRNVLMPFSFSDDVFVFSLIMGIGCLSIIVGIFSHYFVFGVFYQIQTTSSNSGRFTINNQKIKEKLMLIAIYGFVSFVGFILTSLFYKNNPESNLFLLFVDFGVIFLLGLIFWIFGLKSLRDRNFEFPIRSETAEKDKIVIEKKF